MSLNKFMHPRNIYKSPINFSDLLETYPSLRDHINLDLHGKIKFDWSNNDALRELTRILLLRDFQLNVHIPANTLVPALPNRLNYILWVEDLLQILLQLSHTPFSCCGLDIGTGACAIYCLLGASKGWRMIGTERNQLAFEAACSNVTSCALDDCIQILPASISLLSPLDTQHVHFCMCNPPFFDTDLCDVSPQAGVRKPRRPATLVSSCASQAPRDQVVCEGGERKFVSDLIAESRKYSAACRIFTTLLGHKSSVRALKRYMYEVGARAVVGTEFCQGHTKRWGLAWTFDAGLAEPLRNVPTCKQVKPRKPLEYQVPRGLAAIRYTVEDIKQVVVEWLTALEMKISNGAFNNYYASYKISAQADTWSHSRRKRRELARALKLADEHTGAHNNNKVPPALSSGTTAGDSDDHTTRTKRLKLDTANDGGRVAEGARIDGVCQPQQEPQLVFTLRVQCTPAGIFLLYTYLHGALGRDGVNGVLLHVRNRFGRLLAGTVPATRVCVSADSCNNSHDNVSMDTTA